VCSWELCWSGLLRQVKLPRSLEGCAGANTHHETLVGRKTPVLASGCAFLRFSIFKPSKVTAVTNALYTRPCGCTLLSCSTTKLVVVQLQVFLSSNPSTEFSPLTQSSSSSVCVCVCVCVLCS
jgi:hypothetical protein